MNARYALGLAIVAAMALAVAATTGAADTAAGGEEPAAEFTEAFLKDPAVIQTGLEVWQDQCRHCHGKAAYPGKAPKLRPGRYTPDFAYDRVTNGFRKMPSWKDVYSQEERMAVVAYVLSSKFSP